MAAPKKASSNINLLPQEEFASSTTGRILRWLLSTFRYLVIVTEMIVIAAFISRFYFDSRIADLNEETEQKQDFIRAYSDFESEFRLTQKKLNVFASINNTSNDVSPLYDEVVSRLPELVQLEKVEVISNAEVKVEGSSLSESSISQLISNLRDSNMFEDISISSVDSKEGDPYVSFTLNAIVRGKSTTPAEGV